MLVQSHNLVDERLQEVFLGDHVPILAFEYEFNRIRPTDANSIKTGFEGIAAPAILPLGCSRSVIRDIKIISGIYYRSATQP